jgi:hypothetical protein
MPTFICGALILFFLPSGPGKCRFLNERENAVAYARVFQGKPGEQEKGLNLKRMSRGLIRPWTWLIAIIHFCGSTAFNSISVFLTAILRDVSLAGMVIVYDASLTGFVTINRWVSLRSRLRECLRLLISSHTSSPSPLPSCPTARRQGESLLPYSDCSVGRPISTRAVGKTDACSLRNRWSRVYHRRVCAFDACQILRSVYGEPKAS